MAKNRNPNADDLLRQLKELITPQATQAKPVKQDNRKVVAALTQAQKALGRAIALLNGNTVEPSAQQDPETAVDMDSTAPYGRKKDGTPKQRPGRSKA
jgi:phage-related minor tail protein